MQELSLLAELDGERLDAFIARSAQITRSASQKLILVGNVKAQDGQTLKKNHRVTRNERILVTLPDISAPELKPESIPLDIVYEDGDVVVVNKPRGMVVHPAPGHYAGTLVNALLEHCGDTLSGVGGISRPGIVHRLDKQTSGLIIAAKNDFAHLNLSAQLKDKSLGRIYEAVAVGGFSSDTGTISAPIGRHPHDRKRMAVTERNSRFAVTHYEVITRFQGYTHIRCILETGRTHQIRVHMTYSGHPLLGDEVYGHNAALKSKLLSGGQCLHARRLAFTHPRTEKRIELSSSLPEYFTNVLARLAEEF